MEPPWIVDLSDDLQSVSFNSTTTTTATDINRSTSSGSETTWTTSTYSIPNSTTATTKLSIPFGASLSLSDLRFVQRLGTGDIGSVYLAEIKLSSTPYLPAVFAAKVMDKRELASRNKEGRSRTEKEILEMLEHPFLPTLYASLESMKWSCLLTEFCPDGDLHILRQRQSCKRFPESAVRFAF